MSMLPNNLTRNRPGEPLEMRSSDANAARKMAGQGNSIPIAAGLLAGRRPPVSKRNLILNATGQDLNCFSVLEIDGLVEEDAADTAFRYNINGTAFVGKIPTGEEGKAIAILTQSVRNNQFGQCVLFGQSGAWVRINDPLHQHAVPIAGDPVWLESAESGSVRILGHNGSFCVVTIGCGGGGGGNPNISDYLQSTLVFNSMASTREGYLVTAPTMMPGRSIEENTPILHDGKYVIDWRNYASSFPLPFPVVLAGVVSKPVGLEVLAFSLYYYRFAPVGNAVLAGSLPFNLTTLPIAEPCFIYLFFGVTSGTTAGNGPWTPYFIRGSIADADLIAAAPVAGTPTMTVTLSLGSWVSSVPTEYQGFYAIQYYWSNSTGTPVLSNFADAPVSGELTVPAQPSAYNHLWVRLAVAPYSSGGVATGSVAYTSPVYLGQYTRT